MLRSLSTSEFAQALGISDSTVRRLADSGEIEIHRTKGGHRRIPVAAAIRYVRATRSAVVRPDLLGLDINSADSRSDADSVSKMLRFLEAGKAAAVISYAWSLYADGMSIASLCDGPIRGAMQAIGDRWPHDRRAIFIEHRAMTICVRALNQIRAAMRNPEESAPKAMGAGLLGSTYLLPTLMSSLVLHDVGYNETDLGPNTPLDVLADAVAEERPPLVWLSVSEPLRSNVQEHEFYHFAASVEQLGCKLVIGGQYANKLREDGSNGWTHCSSMQELHQIAMKLLEA